MIRVFSFRSHFGVTVAAGRAGTVQVLCHLSTFARSPHVTLWHSCFVLELLFGILSTTGILERKLSKLDTLASGIALLS